MCCLFSCVKPDRLVLDEVLGVCICDSENPRQKPRIPSVDLEEMLIYVDQETHTCDNSLLPNWSYPILGLFLLTHELFLELCLILFHFSFSLFTLNSPMLFPQQTTCLGRIQKNASCYSDESYFLWPACLSLKVDE